MARRMVWAWGAVLLAAGAAVAATDATAGKALHDASCLKCHGTDVYASPQRKVKSLDVLKEQVGRCAKAAETGWTAAQVADVVEYLNSAFYQFK